jgi:hypothetical protein
MLTLYLTLHAHHALSVGFVPSNFLQLTCKDALATDDGMHLLASGTKSDMQGSLHYPDGSILLPTHPPTLMLSDGHHVPIPETASGMHTHTHIYIHKHTRTRTHTHTHTHTRTHTLRRCAVGWE